jgi:hypothetical protein
MLLLASIILPALMIETICSYISEFTFIGLINAILCMTQDGTPLVQYCENLRSSILCCSFVECKPLPVVNKTKGLKNIYTKMYTYFSHLSV